MSGITVSAVGEIGVQDNVQFIECDLRDVPCYIYLPTIASRQTFSERKFYVNDYYENAGTNPIIIVAPDGYRVNGQQAILLNKDGISALIVISGIKDYIATLSIVSGGGGGDTYVNPNPTTISVGGYPSGSKFPIPQTMQQMWDNLLYPYIPPAFTSFLISGQSTLIEVGVPLSGIKTFNWSISNNTNVQANSIAIRDVNANVLLASGLVNDGTQDVNIGTIVNTAPISQNWRGEAINTQSAPFNSANFNVTSIHPVFYGKVASGGAGAGQNRPVANQALIDSGTKLVIPSSGTITLSFNTTSDDYMWFAEPAYNPSKTIWYVNALNTGNIGGAVSAGGNLFPDPDVVSVDSPTLLWNGVPYKIYIANYQSAVSSPMELRNN
jgi:hypothetical protein